MSSFFLNSGLLFLKPRTQAEGSLGAYAPWDDTVGNVAPSHQARGLHVRRRPERSEGCLAIARPDGLGVTFLNSLKGCFTLRMD